MVMDKEKLENSEQATFAIALSIATEINENCETQEDVDRLFKKLKEVLKQRYEINSDIF